MIKEVRCIPQPVSGEYRENIYNIDSCWNSSNWTWLLFYDGNEFFCGNFRGEYFGNAISDILEIVVVITSDYIYVLDINTSELIDYESNYQYKDIIATPLGELLLSYEYGIEIMYSNKLSDRYELTLPIQTDGIKFHEIDNNILRITCYEFLNWNEEKTLYFDCMCKEFI